MILEYHRIDRPEGRWTRTPENFRRDLERLWERGYRLVSLGAFLDGAIALPRGTTPVILTFDDSSPGQFRLVARRDEWALDPECAVAILEDFERQHPEFGHVATFYVLPGADRPNRLFDQPELATHKLQYLASHGYEIGNHTLWHANLSRYPEATVRDRKSTRLNSSHLGISYAVFCLKKKKKHNQHRQTGQKTADDSTDTAREKNTPKARVQLPARRIPAATRQP